MGMGCPVVLSEAPRELIEGRLERLGEGIGKVVYASPHWVVKRDREPREVVALIVLWKIARNAGRFLPLRWAENLLKRPSRRIRLMKWMVQGAMVLVPKGLWFTTHVREMWSVYFRRSIRGERLAREHLSGTALVPERICFPPTRVTIGGWPGWLLVSEATERVDNILFDRLTELSQSGRYEEMEELLHRFLELRRMGWARGLFSVDAHLKNFGVIGARVVLLDTGGLTNRWTEIEEKLEFEEVVEQPHIQLGLGALLGGRPDIAGRFDEAWKSAVNREVVKHSWPALHDRDEAPRS